MARPDSTPVSLTPDAIKAMIQHAVHAKQNEAGEACGFIFGNDGVGQRAVAILNVHSDPASNFQMSDQGVIEAMIEADTAGEELIAVYHSHPASDPIPSDNDKATPDVGPGSPVYLIVSLKEPDRPVTAAWRIDLPFIGSPRATQVAIHASMDGEPYIANPPLTPWAVTVGNKVALTYQRPGHVNQRTIVCEITGAKGSLEEPGKVTLSLKSAVGTDPKVMLVERIKAARVLRESPAAGRVRQRVAAYGRALATTAEHSGFNEIGKYTAFIDAAFPAWLKHVEGE